MFDRAEIQVKAGDGGDGAISFRREKFVPFGGPDGGNGGTGGSVIFVADRSVTSLKRYIQRRMYKADAGTNGRARDMHGKNGDDLVLAVPVGTLISRRVEGDDQLLADLDEDGRRLVVARGGRGGWGNVHYASSTNQAPQIAQRGETGEEAALVLEMRLIADVGIIGYPNAGKSTLLAAASAARPKIAGYPFTTLEPVLGTIDDGQRRFVLAEVPGLIEGAHLGRGLGHEFLRHIMRTRLLVHLADASSGSPAEDIRRLNEELRLYDASLMSREQIVVLNKIDLPEVAERLEEIKQTVANAGVNAMFISAATGEGVAELVSVLVGRLKKAANGKAERGRARKVFKPRPREKDFAVRREGDTWVLESPELERIVGRGGAASPEIVGQIKKQMARMRVTRDIERAGVKPGDPVRCGELQWEWW